MYIYTDGRQISLSINEENLNGNKGKKKNRRENGFKFRKLSISTFKDISRKIFEDILGDDRVHSCIQGESFNVFN